MKIALKIIGGVLLAAGGIYLFCKSDAGKKLGSKVSEETGKVKDSFARGYSEVVEAR
ncbi:MAG: hypothetical protein WCQ99_07580 [Pseudomonadota bacterium]